MIEMQELDQVDPADGVDLEGFNFAGLNNLRGRIDEKMREMRELGGPALLAEMMEKAAERLTVEEVVQLSGKRRGRPSKPREDDSN